MSIEIITKATPELERLFQLTIPQLSTSSAPMNIEQLEHMLSQESLTLFAYRSDDLCTEGNLGSATDLGSDANRPLLGMLSLIMFEIPTGRRAWIEDVVVDSQARGHGAGQALVETAVKYALDHGAKSVDLTSRPSREAANRLYRRAGFELRETNIYRYKG